MRINFDASLKRHGWNIQPKSGFAIPSSSNPLFNAARAIAICAYPNPDQHTRGAKGDQCSRALLAYIFRISKIMGAIDKLPPWIADIRVESMERHLLTGCRNLYRAFTVRDLINSALIMKSQHTAKLKGRRSTFTLNFSPDLKSMRVEIPIEETVSGYILSGRVPDTKLASIRAAILYHCPALARLQGPALKEDGHDTEFSYQNI